MSENAEEIGLMKAIWWTLWPSMFMAGGAIWAGIALDLDGLRFALFVGSVVLVAFGAAGLGAQIAEAKGGGDG